MDLLKEHGPTLGLAIAVITLTFIGRFLWKLYNIRKMCHGRPGPPHSMLWGHLKIMPDIIKSMPRDVAPQALLQQIQEKHNLGDVWYFDSYPFSLPMIVACHPTVSDQFVVTRSMPKSTVIADFTEPLGGRENLVADDGERWRVWRRAFNGGFALSHLMGLVPEIVDHVNIFKQLLEKHSRNGDLFRMEHLATRVTIEIIGKVVLDTHLHCQLGENKLVSAFESQVRWLPIGPMTNPEELVDFRRPFMLWKNKRDMNAYLSNVLDQRFATRKDRGKSKYVIDLALEAYFKEKGVALDSIKSLDKDFKKAAIDQVKIFIFAGHDTSSSAICYAFYHLGQDAAAMAAIRQEHNEVFGTDVSKIAGKVKEDPHLLSKLEYTTAVLREVLRLHPPASAIRHGAADFFVTDPVTNERYPTEGCNLLALNLGLHYNSGWGDPRAFRPERWLTKAPAPEGAFREAWVPFSKSPRNCIGQELAMLELKIVLAMCVRSFDFHAAFDKDELDKLKGDGSGYPSDSSGVQQFLGEKAYQIQLGTAKPREGMPCRLSMAA